MRSALTLRLQGRLRRLRSGLALRLRQLRGARRLQRRVLIARPLRGCGVLLLLLARALLSLRGRGSWGQY